MSEQISDLSQLLKNMEPSCDNEKYYFGAVGQSALFSLAGYLQYIEGIFREKEGLTVVFTEELKTMIEGMTSEKVVGPFAKITLGVFSDLNAVGFTAAISNMLAKEKISVNVMAAYYHDHLFVEYARKDDAIRILTVVK